MTATPRYYYLDCVNICQWLWLVCVCVCVSLLKPVMPEVKSVWKLMGELELCVSLTPLSGTSWRCSSQTETDQECWDGSPHMDLTYPEHKIKRDTLIAIQIHI